MKYKNEYDLVSRPFLRGDLEGFLNAIRLCLPLRDRSGDIRPLAKLLPSYVLDIDRLI